MIAAALVVDGLFSLGGLIPDTRPTHDQIFSPIELNYKAVLNTIAVVVFAVLLWLRPRGDAAHAGHGQHQPAHQH
jgi:hypothetical protein